jgi:hypothetical protein
VVQLTAGLQTDDNYNPLPCGVLYANFTLQASKNKEEHDVKTEPKTVFKMKNKNNQR